MELSGELRQLMREHKPDGSLCRYDLNDTHVRLNQLRLPQHQRGKGTLFLARFLAICDAAGKEVRICADPTDEPDDPDTFALVRWYRRFGWKPQRADDNGVWMTRSPQTGTVDDILLTYQQNKSQDWGREAFDVWLTEARIASGCEVRQGARARRP